MIVKREQLAEFDTLIIRELTENIVNYFNKIYPELESKNTLEIKEWVHDKIKEAESYGLLKPSDVLEYIDLHFHHLELNIKPKWIIDLLTHPGRSGERKIQMLIERLKFNKG